jgi:Protein of unknown function (DUF3302)
MTMDFKLQALGPILHWATLVILCVFPVLAAYVIYKLGSLPGAIARSRGHPQADAINICGWMGIITFVLWPLALVWAHSVPDKPISGGVITNDDALIGKLRRASERLAAIERKLPQQPSSGRA